MAVLSLPNAEFVESARKLYAERWQSTLEQEQFGKVIAVEPESGEYVLGNTLSEASKAARQRFAKRPVHIFRVGGGGAVKIGGAISRERIPG